MKTKWIEISPIEHLEKLHPLSRILEKRGVLTQDWSQYSQPAFLKEWDPFLMKGMEEAAALLIQHINSRSRILVFGDYDVDGTCSVAMMYLFLQQCTENVHFYIPDRYEEGYGFSKTGADFAIDNGFNLVITLDCGTKDGERITKCRAHGLDVIVADHHEPDILPAANVVLNPKRKDCLYPFKGLSGCGVGYKLIQAVISRESSLQINPEQYLDLVAIAAGADIVPMIDENRVLVAKGLMQMKSCLRPGIAALLQKSGAKKMEWTVTDLVFLLAPRINAAGRIRSGSASVQLMIAKHEEEVGALADEVEAYNRSRRVIDQEVSISALEKVQEDPFNQDSVVTVVWDESWLKGVIGIVASRLIERIYKPTIVFTESHGVYAGSARSIEGIDMYAALSQCKDELIQFGGHTMAAGMSVEKTKIESFRKKLDEVVRSMMTEIPAVPKVYYDDELLLEQIDLQWVEEMQGLSPFGPENMTPVFLFRNVHHVYAPKLIGADGKHVKCTFRQNKTGRYYDAVGFGMAKDWEVVNHPALDILASLEKNEYNGKVSAQLILKAVRIHEP